MSAWSSCGQPSASQMPCFHSIPRGIDGPRSMPSRAGLHRLPDVDVRMPDDEHVPPCGPRVTASAMRLSFEPGTRWSTSTPTRRAGPGENSATSAVSSSTPSRYSTTTPSTRRSAPQTFSTSSASWRPSTKMRLGAGDPAGASATAERAGCGARARCRCGHGRVHEHDGLAVEQETAAEREQPQLAEAVLEGDDVLLHPHHRAAEPGGGLFDDEVSRGFLGRNPGAAGVTPAGGEYVLSVAVIHHPIDVSRTSRCAGAG